MNIAQELTSYMGIILIAFVLQLFANIIIIFSIRKNTKDIKKIIEKFYLAEHHDIEYIENKKENENLKVAIISGIIIVILILIFSMP